MTPAFVPLAECRIKTLAQVEQNIAAIVFVENALDGSAEVVIGLPEHRWV